MGHAKQELISMKSENHVHMDKWLGERAPMTIQCDILAHLILGNGRSIKKNICRRTFSLPMMLERAVGGYSLVAVGHAFL